MTNKYFMIERLIYQLCITRILIARADVFYNFATQNVNLLDTSNITWEFARAISPVQNLLNQNLLFFDQYAQKSLRNEAYIIIKFISGMYIKDLSL